MKMHPIAASVAGLFVSLAANAADVSGKVVADDYFQIYHGTDTGLTFDGELLSTWQVQDTTFSFQVNPGDYIYVVAWDGMPPHMMVGDFTIDGTHHVATGAAGWLVQHSTVSGRPMDASEVVGEIISANWVAPVQDTSDSLDGTYGTPGSRLGFATSADYIWYNSFNYLGGTNENFVIFRTATPVVAAVPEPETYALLLAGLGVLGWVGRQRKVN
jgi:hypothetical protein